MIILGDSLGNYGNAGADTAGMASTYFNNFQLQQNKLPGMGLYGMPPFYGEFYGNNFYGKYKRFDKMRQRNYERFPLKAK